MNNRPYLNLKPTIPGSEIYKNPKSNYHRFINRVCQCTSKEERPFKWRIKKQDSLFIEEEDIKTPVTYPAKKQEVKNSLASFFTY